MTTRELAHKLLDELPDERLEDAVSAIHALEGRIVDEWGDLSKLHEVSTREIMRRLDEQERAEFGETIAEAWGRTPKRES
jgi:hypothetical protein